MGPCNFALDHRTLSERGQSDFVIWRAYVPIIIPIVDLKIIWTDSSVWSIIDSQQSYQAHEQNNEFVKSREKKKHYYLKNSRDSPPGDHNIRHKEGSRAKTNFLWASTNSGENISDVGNRFSFTIPELIGKFHPLQTWNIDVNIWVV